MKENGTKRVQVAFTVAFFLRSRRVAKVKFAKMVEKRLSFRCPSGVA
jgi:hypothetical protein